MPVLIPFKAAQRITGCSRSTLERLVDAGVFPEPVRVTAGRLAFVLEEVDDWARDRIRGRDEGRKPEDDPVLRATAGRQHETGGPAAEGRVPPRQRRKATTRSRVTHPSKAQNPAALARGGAR